MMRFIEKRVNFDVCTFCNHKCSFCSNSDERTIKHSTTLDEFKKVMQNVMKYVKISELGLSAKGEVLVNNDFTKIVEFAKKELNIPYIYISSNGALLDEKKAIEVLEAGLDSIKFSINATTQDEYKKIHKADDFDKVIQNFKTLLNLKKTTYPKLKLFLSSVVSEVQTNPTKEFEKIFKDDFSLINGVSIYNITYTPKFEKVDSKKQPISKCSIPFRELYINSDGSLGLCCKDYFDEINFGSLIENDFLDIYNSTKFKEVRDMHKTNTFPDNHLCKNCLLYDGGM